MADGVRLRVIAFGAMNPWVRIILTAVAFGQGAVSISAQTSEVTAIVTDVPGAIIAHAEVTFKGEITTKMRTAEDGSVHLKLPYGHYDVTVASPGFKTTKIVDFLVETQRTAALNVTLQIEGLIHDSYPGYGVAVPTTTSDLPNEISARPAAQPTIFTGNWRPARWKPNRHHLGIVLHIDQNDAGPRGTVHFYDPYSEHESIMLKPRVSGKTLAFDVDDDYAKRKISFSMIVEKGGKSAVVKGSSGEMILELKVVKQP